MMGTPHNFVAGHVIKVAWSLSVGMLTWYAQRLRFGSHELHELHELPELHDSNVSHESHVEAPTVMTSDETSDETSSMNEVMVIVVGWMLACVLQMVMGALSTCMGIRRSMHDEQDIKEDLSCVLNRVSILDEQMRSTCRLVELHHEALDQIRKEASRLEGISDTTLKQHTEFRTSAELRLAEGEREAAEQAEHTAGEIKILEAKFDNMFKKHAQLITDLRSLVESSTGSLRGDVVGLIEVIREEMHDEFEALGLRGTVQEDDQG